MRIKFGTAILFFGILITSHYSFGQEKKYKIALIGFYNLENFFDTIQDRNKNDHDFLPDGPYHYTSEVYHDKVHHLATVISEIGTDLTLTALCHGLRRS